MGLELKLLPFDHQRGEQGYSQTVLSLQEHRALFDALRETLVETPVPREFNSFLARDEEGDYCYALTYETDYGDPLGAVTAADLLRFRDHSGVRDTPKNRAAWAYLAELPPDTRVALFWC